MKLDISRRSFLIGGAATIVAGGIAGAFGFSKTASAQTHKMKKAQWIWPKNPEFENSIDTHAEFKSSFEFLDSNGEATVEIACDSMYACFVNDKLAAFAQCSDWPDFKYYDKLDITEFCKNGPNDLRVQIWHGPASAGSTYKTDTAGVIFEVLQNKEVLAYSSAATLSRFMNEYWNGRSRLITGQMGFDFWYGLDANPLPFKQENDVDTEKNTRKLHEREILPLQLENRVDGKYLWDQTDFKEEIEKGFTTQGSVMFDLGSETVGFLDVKFRSKVKQQLHFCYGEHIVEKDKFGKPHVRFFVGGRDFTVHVEAKADPDNWQQLMEPFRRLGCRYIEVFYEKERPEFEYVGIRPVMYPFQEKSYSFPDAELKGIYEACIKTLKCGMHEHYEDCPWREQALYGMDSRNQMLCGYYAFEGHEYQRHNLILLAHSLRKDEHLLEICSPCDTDRPIPFFSLCFILATYEYLEHTKDKSILKLIETQIDSIMSACAAHIDNEAGLIYGWNDPPFWNFYEWADESSGEDKQKYHLIMNCMYVYVHELWKTVTGKSYIDADNLREKIVAKFLKNGKYVLHDGTDRDSQLGNSMVLLAGIGDDALVEGLAKDLLASQSGSGSMIKATLSMKAFVYDALLQKNKLDIVLQDIRFCFSKMMKDPTFTGTFWETEDGQRAFDNAGSLCHGWSAIPAYYLPKYYL